METTFTSVLAKHIEDTKLQGTGLPWGFPRLQEHIGYGLVQGRVYMLQARTAVGKSAFLANVAVAAQAAAGKDIVGIASLEMKAGEYAARMLSVTADAAMSEIEASMVSSTPQSVILDSIPNLQNMHIRDNPAPRWTDLGDWVDQVQQDSGQKFRVMFVDHLLLMGEGGNSESVQRVQQLGREAKVFAKEYDVALFCLHQTGRGGEEGKDHGHRPVSLSSGLWGGEQDTDVTLGMYRPYLNPLLSLQASETVKEDVFVQVLKNRHGAFHPKGMKLHWPLPSMRMSEVKE